MVKYQLIDEFKRSGKPDKSVFQTLIFRVLGLGLIFLLQILLARLMGPKNYGDYTIIVTIINVGLVVSIFGFDSSVQRFLPAALQSNKFSKGNGFLKFSAISVFLSSLCCSVVLFSFLLFKSKNFNSSFNEGLFWGIFSLPVLAFSTRASAILRSIKMIKLSLLPAYFLFPVMMAVSCWYYFSIYHKLTVDAVMLIGFCISIVIYLYINRRKTIWIKEVLPEVEAEYDRKLWISVSSLLLLTTGLDLLLKQSDILMVGYFLGNTKAGLYGVAAKLATLAALGLAVADYIIMPKISSLYESKQMGKLQQTIRSAAFQILSISLPVIAGLIIFGKFILGFFGKTYQEAYLPLLVLLVGQLINAMTGMVGGLMTMTGHQKQFFIFYFFAILLQFGLNIVLINQFGIIGASLGTSIAMIFLNVSAYRFVKRKLKIRAGIL